MSGCEEGSAQTGSSTAPAAPREQGCCWGRGCPVSALGVQAPPVRPGDRSCCSGADSPDGFPAAAAPGGQRVLRRARGEGF